MPHKLYIKEEEKNDEWKHLPKKESSSKCEKVNIISYSTYADAAGADDPMLFVKCCFDCKENYWKKRK